MFQEVKDALPVSGDAYDAQIIREIKACALDLTTSAEIELPGEIAIYREQDQNGAWTVTDESDLTDELNLLITDYAQDDEEEAELRELWDANLERLHRVSGL